MFVFFANCSRSCYKKARNSKSEIPGPELKNVKSLHNAIARNIEITAFFTFIRTRAGRNKFEIINDNDQNK